MIRRLLLILVFAIPSPVVYAVVGCGPGTDNSECGNVGDPYEGGAPPGGTPLSACLNPMTQNTTYYLTSNVGADPSVICFGLRNGVKLDLRGFTVTGRIDMTGLNANGITIFNGSVNCNRAVATNACIKISSGSAYTAKTRVHHLTVHNANNGAGTTVTSIYLSWSGLDGTNLAIEADHITGYVGSAPTAVRAEYLRLDTAKKSDTHNNDLTCNADVQACQLIMPIPSSAGYINSLIHHNKLTITTNTISGGLPRAIVISGLDSGSIGTQGWQVYNNYCTANNGRCFRFRQVNNLLVHDNEVVNCAATMGYGCYHFTDPSGTTAAVTVQGTGDTVTYVSHGFSNGQQTMFTQTANGITAQTAYFVCNATADTWQLDPVSAACSNILDITSDGTNVVYVNHSFVGNALATIYNETIHLDTGGVAFWLRDGNGWTVRDSTVTGTHGKLFEVRTPIQAPPGGPVPTGASACNITGASGLDVASTAAASTTVSKYLSGTWTGAGTINDPGTCNAGTPAAVLGASPDFAARLVGTSSGGQTNTLTNGGTVALSITSIVAAGDFTQTNDCGASLAAGTSCSITVTFTPTARGPRPGTLTVTDNAADSPQVATLGGSAWANIVSGKVASQGRVEMF